MSSEGAAGLAACFAARRSVMVAGRLVELRALGLERAQQYTTFIAQAFDDPLGFVQRVATDPADANAIILASSDAPQDFVLGLDAPTRVDLVVEIQELNEGAFLAALRLSQRITDSLIRMSGVGPTPSSISSSTDTPTQDSSPLPPPARSSVPSPAPNGAAAASS